MTIETPARYDIRSLRLHWLTAALVVMLWCSGQTIDWFPRGVPRIGARSMHIVVGVLLLCIFAYRAWWRTGPGVQLEPAGEGITQHLAAAAHFLLYVLLAATLGFGVFNAWVRGDSLFNLFKIPAFDPGNRLLRGVVGGWHETLAHALLIVAGIHATAALLHHYVLKDSVLKRMLPERKA
jgi:cytochrome b561